MVSGQVMIVGIVRRNLGAGLDLSRWSKLSDVELRGLERSSVVSPKMLKVEWKEVSLSVSESTSGSESWNVKGVSSDRDLRVDR